MKNAYNRITLEPRPNNREGGENVHAILLDGEDYATFATYEIAAMVRNHMITAARFDLNGSTMVQP